MMLTIFGLAITTLISVIGVLTKKGTAKIRTLLIFLTISGFFIAVVSSINASYSKEKAEARARAADDKLTTANKQLSALQTILSLVQVTVGDLSILNELSGGNKYYVRIAVDTTRKGLEPYLSNLESVFKGARTSGLVSIREPRPGSRNYELVFGQGLDMAAAEVFQRLATSHRLPPAGQIAYILPDPVPTK